VQDVRAYALQRIVGFHSGRAVVEVPEENGVMELFEQLKVRVAQRVADLFDQSRVTGTPLVRGRRAQMHAQKHNVHAVDLHQQRRALHNEGKKKREHVTTSVYTETESVELCQYTRTVACANDGTQCGTALKQNVPLWIPLSGRVIRRPIA
jgi:hypothetical protein